MPHSRLAGEALELAIASIERLGKVPVVLKKDIPSQIGNRLQHALYWESLYLIEQGVADSADIDNIRTGNLVQKSLRGLCDWSERDEVDCRWRRNQRFIGILKEKQGSGR